MKLNGSNQGREGRKVLRMNPTVRPQLSYTTFGDMLPMYTKLEFCNQILTTCGYVPYVWCVQAI